MLNHQTPKPTLGILFGIRADARVTCRRRGEAREGGHWREEGRDHEKGAGLGGRCLCWKIRLRHGAERPPQPQPGRRGGRSTP